MQNIDFYNGQGSRRPLPQYDNLEPEFFAKAGPLHNKDDDRSKNKAVRILFVIIALCIISFTTGLAVGIKFAGGPDREIIDKKTLETMSGISDKMNNYLKGVKRASFPKETYPFVIRVGNQFNKEKSLEIAQYLNKKNHVVVITQDKNGMNKLYLPFTSLNDAKKTLAVVEKYKDLSIGQSLHLIKR